MKKIAVISVFLMLLLSNLCPLIWAQSDSNSLAIEGTNTRTIENGTFYIDHIIVKDDGMLTIRNAKILSTAGYRDEAITVKDNARLVLANSTIMNPTGGHIEIPTRKPQPGGGWLIDPTTGGFLPSTNIDLSGNGDVLINGSVIYGSILVSCSVESNLILQSSIFYSVAIAGDGANINISNCTALTDSSYISGNDMVVMSDSYFEGLGLAFGTVFHPQPLDIFLRISPGKIRSWNIYENMTINHKVFDLSLTNTQINSWEIQLGGYGSNSLKIDNSEITSLSNGYESLQVTKSNIAYLSTFGNATRNYVRTSNISQMSAQVSDDSSLILEDSIVSALSLEFILHQPQTITFANFGGNSSEPKILSDGKMGTVRFANSVIQSWSITLYDALPQFEKVTANILNSSRISLVGIEGNAHLFIDSSSTTDKIWVIGNGTAQIQKRIQFKTQNGNTVNQAYVRLIIQNTVVAETTTNNNGEIFFDMFLDAENCSLYESECYFDIQKDSSPYYTISSSGSFSLSTSGDTPFIVPLQPPNWRPAYMELYLMIAAITAIAVSIVLVIFSVKKRKSKSKARRKSKKIHEHTLLNYPLARA